MSLNRHVSATAPVGRKAQALTWPQLTENATVTWGWRRKWAPKPPYTHIRATPSIPILPLMTTLDQYQGCQPGERPPASPQTGRLRRWSACGRVMFWALLGAQNMMEPAGQRALVAEPLLHYAAGQVEVQAGLFNAL